MSAPDAASAPPRVSRRDWVILTAMLTLMGAGWGITQPLAKIAVSEGYRHLGILFWQLLLGAGLLALIARARGLTLPVHRRALNLYLLIALIGSVLPGIASYEAARHLPSGWLSVVLSLVPLFAFPVALALGIDRFGWGRLLGLTLGLLGVGLLALPWQAWLAGGAPDAVRAAHALWLPLALVAPALYALEGNYVARYGTAGLDPVQLLLGASLIGAAIALPAALATGTFIDPRPPWGAPDLAISISACVHAVVYSGYVWMVGRAGAVFAAQVSYLVTGFGVAWAMLLLGERYGPEFWLALAAMFAGLFLVQPRPGQQSPE
jgi:drug/metabolite transporter (DMT)-like permease